MSALRQKKSWQQLEEYARAHFANAQWNLLKNTQSSSKKYGSSTQHITLDYSEQCINEHALQLLLTLAEECDLHNKIKALMAGHLVNTTEHKPALHTALRTHGDEEIMVNGRNIIPDILRVRAQMSAISTQIRRGEWLGFSGKPITDVVNIGIGGSALGSQFCIHALTDFVTDSLQFHFIAGIDPNEFKSVVKKLKPETTLFIIASKSFTTKETLANMDKALLWLNQPRHIDRHIIAVTANIKKPQELGINNVVLIWNWVGGRYSSCSAINLITCIAIGFARFSEMLSGANEMDKHFLNQQLAQNIPVLLAVLGIWNNNFLKIHNLLILTYAHDFQQFVPYLQQLDMESNGKSRDKEGNLVDYATGPIVWGGLANQAQHSYFQLLYEGTHQIAADLISINTLDNVMVNTMCEAHKKVLGKRINESKDPDVGRIIETSINHISLSDCTPKTIGALMTMYEHKIFTQSIIWNINAFDQPGVELSKQIIG